MSPGIRIDVRSLLIVRGDRSLVILTAGGL
jgi:hypothetical protein